MLTAEELKSLEQAKTADEWNAICDRVKAANDGRYPDDWYTRVVMSGLLDRTARGWTRPS